jgi:RNA-directed DNA polymerase
VGTDEGQQWARTAGVDRVVPRFISDPADVAALLGDAREQLRARTFTPLPVRERLIPKAGQPGKFRRLGIPVAMDRLVQASLVLVLEPIFEADFKPVSYGFRPMRRAQDAIAGDKRVLALVRAFLKAGIMTEEGRQVTGTFTGTPQGGSVAAARQHRAVGAGRALLRQVGRPRHGMAANGAPQARRGHLPDRPLRGLMPTRPPRRRQPHRAARPATS